MNILLIAAGGFFGAAARFCLSTIWNGKGQSGFPWGTLFINTFGSFIIGFVSGRALRETWVLLIGIGFAGAFTTFSTLHLEMVRLFLSSRKKTAILYLVMTYFLGPSAALLGFWSGRVLFLWL